MSVSTPSVNIKVIRRYPYSLTPQGVACYAELNIEDDEILKDFLKTPNEYQKLLVIKNVANKDDSDYDNNVDESGDDTPFPDEGDEDEKMRFENEQPDLSRDHDATNEHAPYMHTTPPVRPRLLSMPDVDARTRDPDDIRTVMWDESRPIVLSKNMLFADKARLSRAVRIMTNDNRNQVISMVTANASASRTPTLAPTEKPKKKIGLNFKWWQQKMFFYLTTFSLHNFIKEDVPIMPEETSEYERFLVIETWKHSDFLCKNYIFSGLEDDLYNIYSGVETSKELWTALEKKYKTKDAELKKFVAAEFLDYKMVDSKSVITQFQKLQVIIHDLLAEGLVINEAFQIAAMIEKLSHLWKDFKNYLKHKRKEMSLEDLIVRLRIEEDNKAAEKRAGHKSKEFCAPKKDKKKGQVNMVEKHEDVDDLCTMLSKCNLVGNLKEWWIDSGATRHVCAIREAFATYAYVGPEETLSMGNAATAEIEGCGKIFLKMTFGKVVTLNNVLHVLEIRKNLVSVGLLVKKGFNKDEATDAFKQYKNEVETQLNKKIKMIRSDSDGEYESPFEQICLEYVQWDCRKKKSFIKGDDERIIDKFR
uniref:Uncharacterized protein LOC104216468 n=1 Tax=Nicotiana sylvestris TaxID=4096 RepID=A0A1U7VSB8_NICSY